MLSVQSLSSVAVLILISSFIPILPIFTQQLQQDFTVNSNNISRIDRHDENSTLTNNPSHIQHSKLPLEAIEESTEELRRKTSTTKPSLDERSISENQDKNRFIHSSRLDSTGFDSNAGEKVLYSIHSAAEHENIGASCQQDSECQSDDLKCVRNRCRPNLESILNKHRIQPKCGYPTIYNSVLTSTTTTNTPPRTTATATTTKTPTETLDGNQAVAGNGGGNKITVYITPQGGAGGSAVINPNS